MTSNQNRPLRFSVTCIGPHVPWNFQISGASRFWNFVKVRDLSLSVCLSKRMVILGIAIGPRMCNASCSCRTRTAACGVMMQRNLQVRYAHRVDRGRAPGKIRCYQPGRLSGFYLRGKPENDCVTMVTALSSKNVQIYLLPQSCFCLPLYLLSTVKSYNC